MNDPNTVQIPPEAYGAIGLLVAANLPTLINFVKDLFKSRTSDAVASALLAEQFKMLTQTVNEMREDLKKNQKDVDEAFRMIREKRES